VIDSDKYLFRVMMSVLVAALESQHNGSNNPSMRSLIVDEKRMMPSHWFGSVLVSSALTLIVG